MGKHKKEKKQKKEKKHKRRKSSSSKSEEWVEKEHEQEEARDEKKTNKREDWMSLSSSFASTSSTEKRENREEQRRLDREKQQYNPRECPRELNPYWKDGGDGLPRFKKPQEDNGDRYKSTYKNLPKTSSGWRKTSSRAVGETVEETPSCSNNEKIENEDANKIAAKLLKAEIMGDDNLVRQLKEQLERARQDQREDKNEEVLLMQTTQKGQVRPLSSTHNDVAKKRKKMETHKDGERVRYFADDDNYSLKQMFENEKFSSVDEQNKQFLDISSKIRKNDDMDDIFADSIRSEKKSDDKKNRNKAIEEHKYLDKCKRCIQSEAMEKHLMVSMGETVYLSLPPYEPLTDGHCFLTPLRHATCSTQLDENEWEEILNFRKSITRMFASENQDVIFFETALNLYRQPHMVIECVPMERETGDLAPIYFKKAIDESEVEWAQNKKLVPLKGRDVRKAIPKGLPYFFVSFGMEEGFAHVVEDEKYFPNNFAQEIIGGMLDLHYSKWKRPKWEKFDEQSKRVLEFAKKWTDFDCTSNNK